MINIVDQNLLDSGADIIAHQVNCKSVMGGGIARQIRERFPRAYEMYMEEYHNRGEHADSLLGKIMICVVPDTQDTRYGIRTVVHLFAQNGYGRGGLHTDYNALRECLTKLRDYAIRRDLSIAIPHGIGCGFGGGDWNGVVYPMILDLFEKSAVDLTICKFTP